MAETKVIYGLWSINLPGKSTMRFWIVIRSQNFHRSSFVGKFKRPGSSTSTPQRSSTWDFDSNKNTIKERHSYDRPSSSSSGGWRKKAEIGTEKGSSPPEVKRTEDKESVPEVKLEPETDSSSSSEEEVEEKKPVVIPAKKITEKDLNDIGAKIVKAEIMGNEVSVENLNILPASINKSSFLKCKLFINKVADLNNLTDCAKGNVLD